MKSVSIFNHVLGPVMRGPSSSHTAGAFHIASMARSILGGTPSRAVLTFDPDGSIRVSTQDRPRAVRLWQATSAKARDFRLDTIGPAYKSSRLADRGGGNYVARVPQPATGWTAFFVELIYDSGGPEPFKFSTSVRVVPDVLPHKDKPIAGQAQGSPP